MPNEIVIALITAISALFGSLLGVITSSKLTNYRLEQLEKKVDSMNDFSTRLAVVEQRIDAYEKKN